jgi:phospholipid N-methyltransferase
MTSVLPPGTLLQYMYLRERLQQHAPGRFVEIGPGYGDITALLLSMGWHGIVYELSPESAAHLHTRFAHEIAQNQLIVELGDFVTTVQPAASADLVISSMVIEHLSDDDERAFMMQARHVISPRGIVINMVPAGMQYWGIEDEIAGHFRRYDRARVCDLCDATQLAGGACSRIDVPCVEHFIAIVKSASASIRRTQSAADDARTHEGVRASRSTVQNIVSRHPWDSFEPDCDVAFSLVTEVDEVLITLSDSLL